MKYLALRFIQAASIALVCFLAKTLWDSSRNGEGAIALFLGIFGIWVILKVGRAYAISIENQETSTEHYQNSVDEYKNMRSRFRKDQTLR